MYATVLNVIDEPLTDTPGYLTKYRLLFSCSSLEDRIWDEGDYYLSQVTTELAGVDNQIISHK